MNSREFAASYTQKKMWWRVEEVKVWREGRERRGRGGGRNQCCPKEERRNILPDGV